MPRAHQYLLQAVVYAAFAVLLGYFSLSPRYTHRDPGDALIKLSISHAGARKGPCRRLSREELAELAPNMRKPLECPRGRVPVVVEVTLDGALAYSGEAPPSGLSGDGPSSVYRRIPVAAGDHRLLVRLRDSDRAQGFDHSREALVTLAPREIMVIDFRPEAGGLVFRQDAPPAPTRAD